MFRFSFKLASIFLVCALALSLVSVYIVGPAFSVSDRVDAWMWDVLVSAARPFTPYVGHSASPAE